MGIRPSGPLPLLHETAQGLVCLGVVFLEVGGCRKVATSLGMCGVATDWVTEPSSFSVWSVLHRAPLVP